LNVGNDLKVEQRAGGRLFHARGHATANVTKPYHFHFSDKEQIWDGLNHWNTETTHAI